MVLLRFTSFPVAETTSVLIVYSSCVTILSKNRTLRRQHPATGFHSTLVPGVTKQICTSDNRGLPPDSCNNENQQNILQLHSALSLPSFRLVSTLSFSFPTLGQCSLPSGLTTPPLSQVSDIFIPREMSKQKEERIDLMMVHKKVAFRSFSVPQEINPVVLSHYLASEHSFF